MSLLGSIGSSSSESKRVDPTATDQGQIIWSKARVAQGGAWQFNLGKRASVTLDLGNGDLARDLVGVVDSTSQRATDTITATIGDALKEISKLTESSQTGGDSERNKIILYVVLGVLGLLAAVFYWRK